MSFRNNSNVTPRRPARRGSTPNIFLNRPRSLGFFSNSCKVTNPYSANVPSTMISYMPSAYAGYGNSPAYTPYTNGYLSNNLSYGSNGSPYATSYGLNNNYLLAPSYTNSITSYSHSPSPTGYSSSTNGLINSLNLAKISNYPYTYSPVKNGYLQTKNGYSQSNGYSQPKPNINTNTSPVPETSGRQSRSVTRHSSFNRDRSSSKPSRSSSAGPASGMGSKSQSLTSLNSEGYYSGSEKNSRSLRLGSIGDGPPVRNENGEIDYKRLWEQSQVDIERLKDKVRKSDEELRETKQTLEKITTVTSKNSLSELEKREKRAMERKLSEMEEELKQLNKFKAENERLRAENRALTRVVSKLTNTAGK